MATDSFNGSNSAAETIRTEVTTSIDNEGALAQPLIYTGTLLQTTGLAAAIITGPYPGVLSLSSNYKLLYDETAQTFAASSAGGENNAVTSLSGNLTFYMNGGDGLVYFGAQADDAGNNPVAGNTLYLNGAGQSFVAMGSGADTVIATNGSDVIATGSGTNTLLLQSGNQFIDSEGSDRIVIGSGHDTVLASGAATLVGGAGTVVYVGVGSGSATLTQGAGTATVFAGSGGGSFTGGTSGNNLLVAGSAATTLIGGGSGDALFATGSAGDVLAAVGNATLSAQASSGNNLLFLGSGNVLAAGGTGKDQFQFGTGNATVFAGTGADTYYAVNGSAGGLDVIESFKVGTDQLKLTGYASGAASTALAGAIVTNGSTVLSLTDGTHIVFANTVGLTSTSVV